MEEWYAREKSVGKVLKKLFFKNLRVGLFITLNGNDSISFLKIIYTNSFFAEYQHGIFWCSYNYQNLPFYKFFREVLNKDTILLIYGEGFRKIRTQCEEMMMFPGKHIQVIGAYFQLQKFTLRPNSNTILYTLQNIDMSENGNYYRVIKKLINYNVKFLLQNGYTILFKNHPRYKRNDPLIFDEEYPFVSFAGDEEPMNMLDDISIHITSKSTTALDVALYGIPTIFIDMLKERSPKDIFFDQYHYPLSNFRVEKPSDLEELLRDLEDQEYYEQCSRKVYNWGCEYYQDFDEQVFLDLISESKKE